MYQIKTSEHQKTKKILIDGNEWTMKSPGSGTQLRLSQLQRRYELLSKKLEGGAATLEDMDKMDEFENSMLDYYASIFNDGTAENLQVKNWIAENSFETINAITAEITKQTDDAGANA